MALGALQAAGLLLSEFHGRFGACPDFLVVRRGPRPAVGAALGRLGVSPSPGPVAEAMRPLTARHLLFQL